jgi:hypothetical protein
MGIRCYQGVTYTHKYNVCIYTYIYIYTYKERDSSYLNIVATREYTHTYNAIVCDYLEACAQINVSKVTHTERNGEVSDPGNNRVKSTILHLATCVNYCECELLRINKISISSRSIEKEVNEERSKLWTKIQYCLALKPA